MYVTHWCWKMWRLLGRKRETFMFNSMSPLSARPRAPWPARGCLACAGHLEHSAACEGEVPGLVGLGNIGFRCFHFADRSSNRRDAGPPVRIPSRLSEPPPLGGRA